MPVKSANLSKSSRPSAGSRSSSETDEKAWPRLTCLRAATALSLAIGILFQSACQQTTATPAERAVEEPRPEAPPAPPESIGLDEDVNVPEIDVDAEVRKPETDQ